MAQRKRIILLAILIDIPIFVAIGFYLSRGEKSTEAVYPERFTDTAAYCVGKQTTRLRFAASQIQQLQTALNSLNECTTIELGAGTFVLNNALTINGVDGVMLKGAGKTATTLRFVGAGNVNGVDVEAASSFTIRDLTILDSPKNGLEVRLSENLVIDNVRVTWSATQGAARSNNGAYGVYPVNVVNVLLQNTESYYASDAGLYVGQCINAIVRRNRAEHNVMGLEIENTVNADVYENTVRNNTGGMLSYDLNKNTIVSRNIRMHHNTIENNNNDNFGSAGIVKSVPAGVGLILTATREVEVYANSFANNNTTDLAIVNGLVSETPDFSQWPMNNWRAHDIYIHDNVFKGGSGTSVDNGRTDEANRPLGLLTALLLSELNRQRAEAGKAALPMANVLYDGVDDGRTILTMTTYFGNHPGNENGICLRNNSGQTPSLIDMNFPALLQNSESPTDATISNAIRKGEVIYYEGTAAAAELYGGQSPAGFQCEGFVASGVAVNAPGP